MGLSRKRRKIVATIADHSKIVCPLALAVIFIQSCALVTWQRPCVTRNWDQPTNFGFFFVEDIELRAANSNVLPPSYVRMKVRSSATSVKFPLRKCGKFVCQEFCSRPTTNVHTTWASRRHTNGPWYRYLIFEIVLVAFDCIVDMSSLYRPTFVTCAHQ